MRKIISLIVISSIFISLPRVSFASNGTWLNNGSTSPSWSNTNNWAFNTVPGSSGGTTSTDIATFNSAIGTNNYGNTNSPLIVDLGRNISGINFDTSAGSFYIGTPSGNSLLLTSGGGIHILNTLSSTNAVERINAPLVLEGASGTYTISNDSANGAGASAGTLDIGGSITAGALGNTILTLAGSNANANTISNVMANGSATSLGITKSGVGTWVLSGSNIYSGATSVNAGTLQAGVANQAFGVGSAVSVGVAGTLDLAGFSQNIGSLAGAGTLTSSALGTLTLTAGVDNTSTEFSGILQNGSATSVGLTKNGTGTLTLTGANTYTGITTISGGNLQIGNNGITGNLGTGNVADNGNLIFDLTNNPTISNIISGTGKLTQNGTGTLTLTGANTYGGGTIVNAGTLTVGAGGTLGSLTGSLSVNNTNIAAGSDVVVNLSTTAATTTGTLSGTIATPSNGTNTATINNGGQAFTVNQLGNGNYAGVITGAGDFILGSLSTSTLILSGHNTYSGNTILNGGTLDLGNTNAISAGTISFNGGTLQYSASNTIDNSSQFSTADGQEYNIDTNGQNVTLATALTSNGGSLSKVGSGTLILTGANTYSGATTISGGNLQVGNGGASGSLGTGNIADNANLIFDLSSSPVISNDILGTGIVTQNGTGTLTFTGANHYTGGTILNAGGLTVGSGGTLGATTGSLSVNNTNSAAGTNVVLNLSTTLPTTTGSLSGTIATPSSGTNTATINNGGQLLTVNQTVDGTYAGVIAGVGGFTLGNLSTAALTLTGHNTYSGNTSLNAGTLVLGSSNAIGAGTVNFNGGTLRYSASNTIDNSSQFSTADGQQYNIDTNGQIVTFATALTSNGGSLTKMGSGTLSLNAANTYGGGTTVNAGTLTVAAAGTLGATTGQLSVNNINVGAGSDVILNLSTTAPTITGPLSGTIATPSSGTNTVTINNGGQLFTVNQFADATYAGVISGGGGFTLGNFSTNTLDLTGNNTYSGGTIINAGKLKIDNLNALGSGGVINNATLSIGANSISLGGAYIQNTGSVLNLTVNSTSVYGKITSAVASSVASGSIVNVNVAGYIQNNSVFDIVNTAGAGVGSAPSTVTSNSSRVSFLSSVINGNLILTAYNSGFSPLGGNPNAQIIGGILDNIRNPTTDMSNILGTLELLSNADVSAALNTLGPILDGGVIENSSAALNNSIGVTLDRIQDVLNRNDLINNSLNQVENSLKPSDSGVSSGDESARNGIWAKPYGSYLHQGTHQGIGGYDAWNAGTVLGVDRMFTDDLTLGISGAYAFGSVDSGLNSSSTDITSGQATVYAGYKDPNFNYFIDAAGSLAWNRYVGRRNIVVGSINRTADAGYNGQQYGSYLGGGYTIHVANNVSLIPLASLQWTHLSLGSYTETNAGSLGLNVGKQGYDLLESGIGAGISSPIKCDWGILTLEVHAKWLHDLVNDTMSVTSSFTGGGSSFTLSGAPPAKDGADLGGKLAFDLKNGISLIGEFETELKNGLFGLYGSGTVRYQF